MDDKYLLSADDLSKVSGGSNIGSDRIFTGYSVNAYDPSIGIHVTLYELSDGSYADCNTGEVFTRTPDGKYYGELGTVLEDE